MSKASVRKAIAQFSAPQLRDVILDLYSRSKEAKELLDFFAEPEIDKKEEEYIDLVLKETNRRRHGLPAMRLREIRSIIKKFTRLGPGDEAVGDFMARCFLVMCKYVQIHYVEEKQVEQIGKLFEDTLKFLEKHRMAEEYMARFEKAIDNIPHESGYRYPYLVLNRMLSDFVNRENRVADDEFLAN